MNTQEILNQLTALTEQCQAAAKKHSQREADAKRRRIVQNLKAQIDALQKQLIAAGAMPEPDPQPRQQKTGIAAALTRDQKRAADNTAELVKRYRSDF